MRHRMRLIGGFISPYVRKVLLTLYVKGIEFELDPILVFEANDEFTRMNPLRQVPVLVNGALEIADSTVICEYLEEIHPSPSVYPDSPDLRARARWVEEYADTRLADVLIWRYYHELTIKPLVWKRPPDQRIVDEAKVTLIPGELDFLESFLPADEFLFGEPMLADYSVVSFFRTAAFADFQVDQTRWPKTASYIDRVNSLSEMKWLEPFEKAALEKSSCPLRHRLAELGMTVSASTVGGAELKASLMRPVPGLMRNEA